MADENVMNQTSVVTPHLEEQPKSDLPRSHQTSEDLPSGVFGEAGPGDAQQTLDDAKDRVRTFRRAADQYVRENPAKAVFSALGFGFVLGLIFRR